MDARSQLRAVALAALLAAAPGAPAAGDAPHPAPPDGAAAHPDGQPLTLDEAVELVKHRFDARVVRAEETKEGDEVYYRIRLLAIDGRVFSVRVSARTGRVE
jgi:uncharacterized membrane protein YkoI